MTLVELLVVIAVIGVLISITVSVMGKARTETEGTTKASDLHQIVAMCTSYSAAHGGKTPFAPPDREEDGSVSAFVRIYLPQDGWVAFPYFAQSMLWQAYLHSNGFGVSELPGIPDSRTPNPFMTSPSYFASQSFLANSRYWAVDAVQQQEDWRFRGAVRGVQRWSCPAHPDRDSPVGSQFHVGQRVWPSRDNAGWVPGA